MKRVLLGALTFGFTVALGRWAESCWVARRTLSASSHAAHAKKCCARALEAAETAEKAADSILATARPDPAKLGGSCVLFLVLALAATGAALGLPKLFTQLQEAAWVPVVGAICVFAGAFLAVVAQLARNGYWVTMTGASLGSIGAVFVVASELAGV